MSLTYKDFEDELENSGLKDQFSSYDLAMAQQNPEFGMTMLSYKKDYNSATDQAGKDAANSAAEALRRQYGNYLGGSDGSQYYSLGPSPGGYQSQYQDQIGSILDQMQNYGDFSYESAPTYNSRYQSTLDNLLNQVLNYKDFSWSKETDPAYSAYAKQYRREGDRATQSALAQAAAMTGGQVSSAAMTAASQAGDYYAGQLADVIPQLYDAAYSRYLSDYGILTDKLGQTQQMEQMDYAKYQDQLNQYNTDRNLNYDQWLQGYNMLSGNLSALQGQDDREYGRLLDQVDFNSSQQALAQAQVDAMLQAGAMPSADLIGQSGYDTSYVQALDNYYKQQAAAKASSGSSSGGGDDTGSSIEDVYQWLADNGATDYGTAYQMLRNAGYTATDANRYAKYFSDNAGNYINSGADTGLADMNVGSILNLGMGPLSYSQVEKMVDDGILDIVDSGNMIGVKWASDWDADKYKKKKNNTFFNTMN